MISAAWHVTVQNRFPGRPLFALDGALDGPVPDAVLRLVELQADARIPAGDRDFTGYVANVLFDDWDQVRAGAARACAAKSRPVPICACGGRIAPASLAPRPPGVGFILSAHPRHVP
jgi:hypothetical protein